MVSVKVGSIETELYTKPTDKHQYLLVSSCHPQHTKRSISFSLALRLRRICSNPDNYIVRTRFLQWFFTLTTQQLMNEAEYLMRNNGDRGGCHPSRP